MKLASNSTEVLEDSKLIESLSKYEDVILFGAGRSGDYYFEILKKNKILPKCYCDNFKTKQNTTKNGINIYSFEDSVKMHPQAAICITSVFSEDIYKQIIAYNEDLAKQVYFVMNTMAWETDDKALKSVECDWINENISKLEWFHDILSDELSKKTLEAILNYRITRNSLYLDMVYCKENTYFDKSLFLNSRNFKVFLDGGSYTGDTLISYFDFVNYSYDKVICFEPDESCFKVLKETINKSNFKNVDIYCKALWSTNNIQNFLDSGACGGMIKEECDMGVKVETEFIDALLLKKLDFVKLDIEGAEYNAILGMRETIKKCKPVLAISAYHKQDDFIRIPQIILEICNEYKFYLRQYMHVPYETVLYAIPS